MPDLTEFLLARIAEDEAVARAARISNGEWVRTGEWAGPTEIKEWINPVTSGNGSLAYDQQEHIARWDPARVLAECAAKRQIVQVTAPQEWTWVPSAYETVRLLALPYADHPDYDPEWRP